MKTPSLKQKLFAKKYVENKGNATKAALEVYDADYESAKSISYENMQKPVVQEAIKDQLNKAGLTLDVLNEYALGSIKTNIEHGKPSQAAGVAMLQFAYKLHNALPATKHMNVNMSLKGVTSQKNVDELVAETSRLSLKSQELIADLKGK